MKLTFSSTAGRSAPTSHQLVTRRYRPSRRAPAADSQACRPHRARTACPAPQHGCRPRQAHPLPTNPPAGDSPARHVYLIESPHREQHGRRRRQARPSTGHPPQRPTLRRFEVIESERRARHSRRRRQANPPLTTTPVVDSPACRPHREQVMTKKTST